MLAGLGTNEEDAADVGLEEELGRVSTGSSSAVGVFLLSLPLLLVLDVGRTVAVAPVTALVVDTVRLVHGSFWLLFRNVGVEVGGVVVVA